VARTSIGATPTRERGKATRQAGLGANPQPGIRAHGNTLLACGRLLEPPRVHQAGLVLAVRFECRPEQNGSVVTLESISVLAFKQLYWIGKADAGSAAQHSETRLRTERDAIGNDGWVDLCQCLSRWPRAAQWIESRR